MPNVKFIGGFHCKPAQNLTDPTYAKFNPALATWVDGAEDGLIVFSMGSMVRCGW